MESVGTHIRTARVQAGVSLEQVSVQTCIPVQVLQAIEEDDLRKFSSAFFYKSFVRQFCAHIGLTMEKLQEPIASATASFPEPLMPGHGEAVIRSALVKDPKRGKRFRWLLPAVSLATVFVACSGFYAYWERLKTPELPAVLPPPVTIRLLPEKGKTPPSTTATPGLAQSKAVVPAEPDGLYHVELSAVERTWLSIRADGKQIYSGTLEVDQTKVLEGHQEGQLRTGNAGGVNIVFNGKPIGLAGPHGSVRTVVFKRDNYEVLPDAVHTAFSFQPRVIDGWLRLLPAH